MRMRTFAIFLLAACLPRMAGASEIKIVFAAGAAYRPLPGYSYDYSRRVNPGNDLFPAEYGTGTDRIPRADIYAPEFRLGAAFKNVSLELSGAPFSDMFSGSYELRIPSMWTYNQFATDRRVAPSKISGVSFEAHLKYSVPFAETLRVYAGMGGHFLLASMELANNILTNETYTRIPGLGYVDHRLEIMDIEFTAVNIATFGAVALAGVEFRPVPQYWIFLEGRYRSGKKDVPHPYYSQINSTLDPVRLDFSGFVFSFGIRTSLGL